MSPLTHGMIGWIVSQPLKTRRDRILVTSAALLPDLDGMGLIISFDYYRLVHHTFGHSVFFGIFLSFLFMSLGKEKFKVLGLAFVSFNTHILGDLLGSGKGWGVPYFWPVDKTVFEFSGPFQWQLNSWQNLVATLICLIVILLIAITKKRSLLEIASKELDAKFVSFVNRLFRRT